MASTDSQRSASPTDQYLAALLAHPTVATVPVSADGQPLSVEQIYVPRTVLHEVVQKKTTRDEGESKEVTLKLPVDLWEKVRDQRVVLLEGPAGMGKSTLTKHLVRESYAQQRWLPIWIPFRTFAAARLPLREYLETIYVPWLGLSDARVERPSHTGGQDLSLGQWLYDQWWSGLGLLILDGLDEVFAHDERVALLRGLPAIGTTQTRPATILTSRPLSQSLPLQMATVELQGLTPQDQALLLDRYRRGLHLTESQVHTFRQELQQPTQGRVHELLTRPGHLIQILTAYAQTGMLPTTETEVVEHLIQGRLTITGRIQPPVEPDDLDKKRSILESLALHLVACRQGQRHTRAQLLALIRQVLHEWVTHDSLLFPLSQASALLNDLTRNSGLLTEVEPEVYEFETVIWAQFLTGCALAHPQTCRTLGHTEAQVFDLLDKKAWDPEWEPVLKSWVGNTGNPLPFLDGLSAVQKDDLARHRLGVAGRCLREVPASVREQRDYQALATRIPTEAAEVWRALVTQGTEKLVEHSLRMVWGATPVGQAKLVAHLTDADWQVRRAAVQAVSQLGASLSVAAQGALVARLTDKEFDVRRAAGEALGQLGASLSPATQAALVVRLMDADWEVRYTAVLASGQLGPSLSAEVQALLVARLTDKHWKVCEAAVRALGQLGPSLSAEVQALLVAHLTVKDQWVRWKVVEALHQLGASLSPAVQAKLVARLTDEDGDVRRAAVLALGQVGASLSAATQAALVARLMDEDGDVRRAAVEALGQLGPSLSAEVQALLVARLTDVGGNVRRAAVEALGQLGASLSPAVQAKLVARLTDEDGNVRRAAVEALGQLGASLSPAVQAKLVARLTDEDGNVRRAAVEALGQLGPSLSAEVQALLVARLTDVGGNVRRAAVLALGQVGASLLAATQAALMARLTDVDGNVRRAAGEALGQLGASLSPAVQAKLVARLTDEDGNVRRAAVEALGQLGASLSPAVQAKLVARLTDVGGNVRRAAVEALGQLGASLSAATQAALMARLTDEDWEVREVVAGLLTSAQQLGLRFYLTDTTSPDRFVSNLSATAPFPDCCQQGYGHRAASLELLFQWRMTLTLS